MSKCYELCLVWVQAESNVWATGQINAERKKNVKNKNKIWQIFFWTLFSSSELFMSIKILKQVFIEFRTGIFFPWSKFPQPWVFRFETCGCRSSVSWQEETVVLYFKVIFLAKVHCKPVTCWQHAFESPLPKEKKGAQSSLCTLCFILLSFFQLEARVSWLLTFLERIFAYLMC